jgi:hypothetical protein
MQSERKFGFLWSFDPIELLGPTKILDVEIVEPTLGVCKVYVLDRLQ